MRKVGRVRPRRTPNRRGGFLGNASGRAASDRNRTAKISSGPRAGETNRFWRRTAFNDAEKGRQYPRGKALSLRERRPLMYPDYSMDIVVFQDDLPSISVSRLRALGVITAEMTRATIGLGGVEVEVDLSLQKFPNGGSWSLFRCPCCGRKARTLRLLDGCVLCRHCCVRRGAGYWCRRVSLRRHAERRIPKLRAMLETPTSLRLKPVLWGKLERRSRLEAALARCEYIVSKSRRFRDVHTEEIEIEPIARPKTTSSR
jgi:hypothetical protein